jgi:hypothetical protein
MIITKAQEKALEPYEKRWRHSKYPEVDGQVLAIAYNLLDDANTRGHTLSLKKEFYAYALLDPRKPGPYTYWIATKQITFSYEPFYVGKGKGNRMYNHENAAHKYREKNPHNPSSKVDTILAIQAAGLKVITYKFSDALIEPIALGKEEILIEALGQLNDKSGILTNIASDGRGFTCSADRREHALSAWNSKPAKEKKRITAKRVQSMLTRPDGAKLDTRQRKQETWSKKSDEELEEIRQKKILTHASRDPAEVLVSTAATVANTDYEEANRKRAEAYAKKSDEEKLVIKNKRAETMARKSDKEKLEIRENLRNAAARKTSEDKEADEEKRQATRDSRTAEYEADYRAKLRAGAANSKVTKITDRQVVEIFLKCQKYKDTLNVRKKFAERFGVSLKTVSDIASGKQRKFVLQAHGLI